MNTIQQINILFWMNMIFTGIFVILAIYHLGRIGIRKLLFRNWRREKMHEEYEEYEEMKHNFNSVVERHYEVLNKLDNNEKTRTKKVR